LTQASLFHKQLVLCSSKQATRRAVLHAVAKLTGVSAAAAAVQVL
jgi:hypothetical protein